MPDVILPLEHTTWLNEQPENVLSAREGQLYFLSKYTFSHPRLHRDTLEANLARTAMILCLQTLQTQVWDELVVALDDAWGHDTEWRSVNVYHTMWTVVARTANRAVVGAPLCRDEGFLAAVKAYVEYFATQGVLIRFLCPDLLKPVLGRLLAQPVHWRYRNLLSGYLTPLAERLASGGIMGEDTFSAWLSEAAQKEIDPADGTPDAVAGQIASAEFAPLHTSTFAVVNTLLDLLTSPGAQHHLDALRDEADSVLINGDSASWQKSTHLQLDLADSAIKESQRVTRTSGKALLRRVVAHGVILSDGTSLPKGVYVGLSMEGAHQDPDFYEHPERFEPFRFAKATPSSDTDSGVEFDSDPDKAPAGRDSVASRPRKLVTTGPDYLSFGHGKHGCPGRFFVAQFLTIMLALISQKYDIQPLSKKPKGHHISDHYKPPEDAMIMIRRRASAGRP